MTTSNIVDDMEANSVLNSASYNYKKLKTPPKVEKKKQQPVINFLKNR